jgi:hypothetical protein
MKMTEIRNKAKGLGLAPDKRTPRTDLVRAIQTAEGYTACFNTGVKHCPYLDCCFREDCDVSRV